MMNEILWEQFNKTNEKNVNFSKQLLPNTNPNVYIVEDNIEPQYKTKEGMPLIVDKT